MFGDFGGKHQHERPLLAESGPSILRFFEYLNVRFREKLPFKLDQF